MQTVIPFTTLVGIIDSESERFKEYVSALPQEALERPSPCERWSVGEVIAHLIWFAENYGGMIERGLRGDQSTPEGFPAVPGTMNGSEIAEFYGSSAIELRRTLGQRLVPAFCERYDWLNSLLKGIGPGGWEKLCYHTLRIRPVENFIPVIVAELAVHDWDIRSTLEDSPHLSEQSLPALMEKLPSNRRPWSTPFETATASPGLICYRFDLKGVVSGRQDVLVENGKARLEPAGNAPVDVSIDCQAETLALLVYGRLTLSSAAAVGTAKVDGDVELISSFDRWLGE